MLGKALNAPHRPDGGFSSGPHPSKSYEPSASQTATYSHMTSFTQTRSSPAHPPTSSPYYKPQGEPSAGGLYINHGGNNDPKRTATNSLRSIPTASQTSVNSNGYTHSHSPLPPPQPFPWETHAGVSREPIAEDSIPEGRQVASTSNSSSDSQASGAPFLRTTPTLSRIAAV